MEGETWNLLKIYDWVMLGSAIPRTVMAEQWRESEAGEKEGKRLSAPTILWFCP